MIHSTMAVYIPKAGILVACSIYELGCLGSPSLMLKRPRGFLKSLVFSPQLEGWRSWVLMTLKDDSSSGSNRGSSSNRVEALINRKQKAVPLDLLISGLWLGGIAINSVGGGSSFLTYPSRKYLYRPAQTNVS